MGTLMTMGAFNGAGAHFYQTLRDLSFGAFKLVYRHDQFLSSVAYCHTFFWGGK
jgi:hypothetical protein